MKCCENCFDDEFLIKEVQEIGKIGDCDYCGELNVYTINIKLLNEHFSKVIKLYTPTEAYEHYDPEVDHPLEVGVSLITLINEDWCIFSKKIQNHEIDYTLLFDILNSNENGRYYNPEEIYSKVKEGVFYKDPLMEWEIYWSELKKELKHENRFFPFFDINNDLLEILKYRERCLVNGDILFRARLGNNPKDKMLAPPANLAKSGRANPHGISYLYCGEDEETCVAEIRPWKGAKITIASLQVNKNLTLIDLSNKEISPFILESTEEILALETLITQFAQELSTPVDPSNSEIEYLPTQYLTELIKARGYDGIFFKSAMGPGFNVVLFNEKNVKVINTKTISVNDILYDFGQNSIFDEEDFSLTIK
ncbi:RES family NAD+ phosphorylase [Halalkalibacter hemicellulosilyticus]|uniref:RES domain-containing protein n=1 Tax=Halalkalibacter hemicellulosilyticusJCM 9152 TaxID=1236971 RepID=W4QL47_9BACI|nr:RES family NAD+ phosphorylase [Halalkalibacter hemicellulosilyticus]GAE32811.1 hypothetical protein JCM9152_4380 [Halalkalibacter hemicellulosilyticusJCM 9152]